MPRSVLGAGEGVSAGENTNEIGYNQQSIMYKPEIFRLSGDVQQTLEISI